MTHFFIGMTCFLQILKQVQNDELLGMTYFLQILKQSEQQTARVQNDWHFETTRFAQNDVLLFGMTDFLK